MLLNETKMPKRTVTALEKKKITKVNDLVRFLPRKYIDYRVISSLNAAVNSANNSAIKGYMQSIGEKKSGYRSMLVAEIVEECSGQMVSVRWFGKSGMLKYYNSFVFHDVVVGGKVEYKKPYGYGITNPDLFTAAELFTPKIIPVYGKIKDVSEDMRKKWTDTFLDVVEDPLDDRYIKTGKLMSYKEALRELHNPSNLDRMKKAMNRLLFDDMLYFTIRMKKSQTNHGSTSLYVIKTTDCTDEYIKNLPYKLTGDQTKAISLIKNNMLCGKRTNLLIQGDVGCGKTMVAMAAMMMMAENGFQSAIMVPRTALVLQHYETFKKMAEHTGFHIGCLTGDMSANEKEKVLRGLASGEINIVVGTHGLFTEKVTYYNLGMVVTDEEHLFSVKQRKALEKKSDEGVHVLSMSATPIPRSLVDVIYGEEKDLFVIKEKPANRIPIQTAINNSSRVIFDFMKKQLDMGRQCYVVCPLVKEEQGNGENENMPVADSAESMYEIYSKQFAPMGYKVGLIHGQMEKEEAEQVRKEFVENQCQILVATTVISVGIDVPNASLVVIHNAERFGLAELHQIRGRVGRGQYKSYCILKSDQKDNRRLQAIVSTTDGMELAKKDLELRGPGDLLGTEQSGNNKYISMIIANEKLYECIKKYADWIIADHMEDKLIALYDTQS